MEEVLKQCDCKKAVESVNEIGKALSLFQNSCPTIEKNTKGYGYKYADLAIIIETIKPHLHKAGLSYSQQPFTKGDEVGVNTLIIHGASGQVLKSTLTASMSANKMKQMTNVQGMGSIITYLRRYSLSSLLGIVTDDDIDGGEPLDKKATTTQKASTTKNTSKPTVKFLTDAQFKKAIESDEKGIKAVLKKFNTPEFKMKADFKKQLEAKLKELTTVKPEENGAGEAK